MTLPKSKFNWCLLSWVLVTSCFLGALAKSPPQALAIVPFQYATHSAEVTATVVDQFFTNPTLIRPTDGSATNNPQEMFSWQEATSTGGINHYFFYLDGQVVFDNIPNNVASYDTASYHLTHVGNIFTLVFKSPFSEGYHTWQVDGVTNSDKTLASPTWTFLFDTTNPIIILTKVDSNNLYWASNDPQSIPPAPERNFIINHKDVLLKGKYEANSNLKLTLVCPPDTENCTNQSILINNSSGNWEHIFRNLLPNTTYTVYLTAVDSASNLTNFPTFTIRYQPPTAITFIVNLIKKVFPVEPQRPTPEAEVTPTPTPTMVAIVTPPPPLAPTPPPVISPIPQAQPPTRELSLISVWGLVMHLSMAIFGAGISIPYIWKFLFKVFLPGVHSTLMATSWSTITYYDPNALRKPLVVDFAAITGLFRYPTTLPKVVFIKVTRPGFDDIKTLTSANRLPSDIELPLDTQASTWSRIKLITLRLRLVPLVAAVVTSLAALVLTHEWYYGLYLYLSLHLSFTEYLYPSISK